MPPIETNLASGGSLAVTSVRTSLSSIQDIELADMAVQASTANVTYQAALQTTASVRQLSLLNFLQ